MESDGDCPVRWWDQRDGVKVAEFRDNSRELINFRLHVKRTRPSETKKQSVGLQACNASSRSLEQGLPCSCQAGLAREMLSQTNKETKKEVGGEWERRA